MIQNLTVLRVADNTGARKIMCIVFWEVQGEGLPELRYRCGFRQSDSR